jgi:WD40 repeat protein
VSASADKTINLWAWSKVAVDGEAPRLSVTHQKAINTGQDVLCVRVSPNGNLIAASLISNVIKARASRACRRPIQHCLRSWILLQECMRVRAGSCMWWRS